MSDTTEARTPTLEERLRRLASEMNANPTLPLLTMDAELLRDAADALTAERQRAERLEAATEEYRAVVRVAASLMDEVDAVHKLTGGGFRDRLRVELVRMAAERGTQHDPAAYRALHPSPEESDA